MIFIAGYYYFTLETIAPLLQKAQLQCLAPSPALTNNSVETSETALLIHI